jgi:hypothetical protein
MCTPSLVIYILCNVILGASLLVSLIQVLFGVKSGPSNILILVGACGLLNAAYQGIFPDIYLSSGFMIAGIAMGNMNRQIL